MTHEIVDTQVTWHRVTLVCACGHETRHPTPEGARALHVKHVGIAEARAALNGKGD